MLSSVLGTSVLPDSTTRLIERECMMTVTHETCCTLFIGLNLTFQLLVSIISIWACQLKSSTNSCPVFLTVIHKSVAWRGHRGRKPQDMKWWENRRKRNHKESTKRSAWAEMSTITISEHVFAFPFLGKRFLPGSSCTSIWIFNYPRSHVNWTSKTRKWCYFLTWPAHNTLETGKPAYRASIAAATQRHINTHLHKHTQQGLKSGDFRSHM